VQQRFHCQQPLVAHVDVRADRQQPLGHRPVAVAQRAFDQRLLRQLRLQLAPQRDAFEQRARYVEPRQPQAERRVHVEMRVDEGRAEQPALGVDDFGAFGGGQVGPMAAKRPSSTSSFWPLRPSVSVALVISSMGKTPRTQRSPLR
jgi:hypothetical protein